MVFNSSLNFGFCLNRLAFNETKTHFYISEVIQRSKELLFRLQFYEFIGRLSKIKTTFSIKIKSYFKFFSVLKTAFDVDRYLFWVLSTCENVRENFEEI